MKLIRNLDTKEGREFWASVEKIAAEVATWPAWMRGAYYKDKNNVWKALPSKRKKK